MTDTPMALEVCLCGDCAAQGHEKEIYRPLTAEEIAQREKDAEAYAAAKAAEEAEAAAKQAEKERIAGTLGITLDELKVLLS